MSITTALPTWKKESTPSWNEIVRIKYAIRCIYEWIILQTNPTASIDYSDENIRQLFAKACKMPTTQKTIEELLEIVDMYNVTSELVKLLGSTKLQGWKLPKDPETCLRFPITIRTVNSTDDVPCSCSLPLVSLLASEKFTTDIREIIDADRFIIDAYSIMVSAIPMHADVIIRTMVGAFEGNPNYIKCIETLDDFHGFVQVCDYLKLKFNRVETK